MECYYKSPIGTLLINGSEKGISRLVFVDEMTSFSADLKYFIIENQGDNISDPNGMASRWINQLDEYFDKRRKVFDLAVDLKGTDFQKKVWKELLRIPFGKTISYKELTLKLGDIKAIRAVAAANAANPMSILVPCHRVIGSDGSLTGYAGGLWRKQWLLDHEKGKQSFTF